MRMAEKHELTQSNRFQLSGGQVRYLLHRELTDYLAELPSESGLARSNVVIYKKMMARS